MPKWLPWRFIAKYVARSQGFIDPVSLYASLQNFSQPSEVAEPVELLRAGIVFHARGLINSKTIQHNLDWVWPFWVERQFNPNDPAFLPRAFSVTHVNLTHRNWSAIGIPDVDSLPIVDPRGLVTPFWDSWSIDVWLVTEGGTIVLPSRIEPVEQRLLADEQHTIQTKLKENGLSLNTEAQVIRDSDQAICTIKATANLNTDGWLVVCARPYNPEGVSFIHDIKLSDDRSSWMINKSDTVKFSKPADRHHMSDYHSADVYIHLLDKQDQSRVHCPVGMATAAAMFRVSANNTTEVQIDVPLGSTVSDKALAAEPAEASIVKSAGQTLAATDSAESVTRTLWQSSLSEQSTLQIPDTHFQELYDASVHTLLLCTPSDVYAGPYTYKRYWYRDAVYICHGLLSAGLTSRVERIVNNFPDRQKHNGYFHSQEGEWDSNGQVLWMIQRLHQFTGKQPDQKLMSAVISGADWIARKRISSDSRDAFAGLLPAGFSAEHLGPNDYYLWDDYWAIAGLEGAASLCQSVGAADKQSRYQQEADSMHDAIERSLELTREKRQFEALPAAPTRRLDAGAVGSIVASYPTCVLPPDDDRLKGTVNFLVDNCFYKNGFFQDMIHSGVNVYLTLQIAQTMLRMGDPRFHTLMSAVARLASPTGHWPEAIHPHTGGGCMGDGHHAWAAAEWIAMIRYCFVREEGKDLILGSGIPEHWLNKKSVVSLTDVPTVFGTISVYLTTLDSTADSCELSWTSQWHEDAPQIRVAVPGYDAVVIDSQESDRDGAGSAVIHRSKIP